jgi:RHH-type rel operon transcriptional repressor/antitoxin RelB
MLALRLPENLETRLAELAQQTGRSKSYYVRTAIEKFLEDNEDYLLAVKRLEEKNPRISFEQVKRLVELES